MSEAHERSVHGGHIDQRALLMDVRSEAHTHSAAVKIKGDLGPQTLKKLAGSLAVIRVRTLWVPSSPAHKSHQICHIFA